MAALPVAERSWELCPGGIAGNMVGAELALQLSSVELLIQVLPSCLFFLELVGKRSSRDLCLSGKFS